MFDADVCYRALKARDTRFDGLFFVAVRSTHVYCRPVCTVKTPKRENCTFFPNAAAAEARGYRPCLRCRPELAPGNASVDAGGRLARAVASAIEDGALVNDRLADLAISLDVADRHLRRVFKAQFGVPPIAYAQTQRLLLAKQLLTDTSLSVTDIAFASGFGSLRRFNALFKQRYRLNPLGLRKRAQKTVPGIPPDTMSFQLSFRPPYDWTSLLGFLTPRTINGVEEVSDNTYRRSVRIERAGQVHAGWIAVSPAAERPALRVLMSSSLARAVGPVLTRIKYMMDLAAHPEQIAAVLGSIAEKRPGLRVPGAFDGFEVAVRAVLGQQISVKGARTIAGRFAAAFGSAIETPFDGVSRIFPSASDVAAIDVDRIAALGVVNSRARTILALARAVANGNLSLVPGADVSTTLETLRALPGIGEWTAQYIAMRAMAWPDAFPHSDLGLRKALREDNPRRILIAAEAWRPWRAYAAMHLWHTIA
jgi:AraC family transcriptional regulator of adaptative response / DNA-3-methyladenine glycosylase II